MGSSIVGSGSSNLFGGSDRFPSLSSSSRARRFEEEALAWAAIERLPTFERLRTSILNDLVGNQSIGSTHKQIDVTKIPPEARKQLIERLLGVSDQDNERFMLKLRERLDGVGIIIPEIQIRFQDLNISADVYVGSRALPTLINWTVNLVEDALGMLRLWRTKRKKLTILHNVNGIVKPGRLTLLLGPPASGKTTLILALAGKLPNTLKVEGEVTYNGYALNEFVPERTAAYISQHDTHMGEMTVRETFNFSARCQGVGSRYDVLTELSRREKQLGLKPDADIDVFMKATAIEGQETSVMTDCVLKILGLDICADTIVGDNMRRGISGGQKKRVTTGEMVVGGAKAFLMDEISTGLDSSTTYQIVRCFSQFVHVMRATMVISLLQPAPETFDLFDDVILLSEGYIVYQGPREFVLEFFESMGFKCPERKGVADFLQEILIAMPRVNIARRTRNTRKRGTQIQCTSSDDERARVPNDNIVTSNSENGPVEDVDAVVPPSMTEPSPPPVPEEPILPPSSTVQGAISTKKISAIRGWTKEDMLAAIDDVEFKGFSVRAAAKKHGIAPTSIHYWINGLTHTKRRGPLTVMTEQEEEEVVVWCKEMAELGHGLELIQLKSTVAQICQGRPNPFKDGFPGKSWWAGFKKRHPELVLRAAEGLDRDRALNLRPTVVSKFYDTLSSAYEKHSYSPDHIWNCDETGLQARRNCGMRVIAKRGSRNVSKILPKSREWITILSCVNAIGSAIPGFYLFKGKTRLQNYIQNCEPGACMAAHPHAWMTKELFLNWLFHFATSVPGGVSPENRHLLVLDGHGSHIAVQTIEEANRLGIDLLTLPAHTTHRLQPLDVSVFGPFKAYFRSERAAWMAQNPGVEVKRFELAELASKDFKRALTPSNIKAGFRRTGIWPLNYDALMHDTQCSQAFDVDGQEAGEDLEDVEDQLDGQQEADAVDNIMSLSQGNCEGVGASDHDEQVYETQFNDDAAEDNMGLGGPASTQVDAGANINVVDGCRSPGSPNHTLSMPTQVSQPSWMAEAMMNLNRHIGDSTNDESMNMPSQPNEIVHFYVDGGLVADPSTDNEDATEEYTAAEEPLIAEEPLLGNTPRLGRFLKFPMERVSTKGREGQTDILRLGRSSQLLTSEEYMSILVDSERKKKDLQELKQRKKDLAKEKKEARMIAAGQRAQERIAREVNRQEKAHQKQLARQAKEARKVQQMNQNSASEMEERNVMADTLRTTSERDMMQGSLEAFASSARFYQDLINIQIPCYNPAGLHPSSIPTTAGSHPMLAYRTPANIPGVPCTSQAYGYSIPPWLQGVNWPQSVSTNPTLPNQTCSVRSPHLSQAGNPTENDVGGDEPLQE